MKDGVLIYRYQYWDEDTDSRKESLIYATEEMIRAGLGRIIYTSAIEVSSDDLIDGWYVPPEYSVTTKQSKG